MHKRESLVALVLLLGLFMTPQLLRADELVEKLDAMEEQAEELENRLFSGIQIHGFLSQGWMRSTDNNYLTRSDEGSFEFNELGLNFGMQVNDNLRLGLQLFSRDLGDQGNNEVLLDWGYGDYTVYDWLGIRAGRIKLPVGQYNETRDVDALRGSVLLPQAVYAEDYREIMMAFNGASFYGTIPMSVVGSLSYQLWFGDQSLDADKVALRKSANAGGFLTVERMKIDSVYGGALEWATPLDGLRFTGSYHQINDYVVESSTAFPYTVVDNPDPIPDVVIAAGTPAESTTPKYKVQTFGGEYAIWKFTFAAEYQTQTGTTDVTIGGTPFLTRKNNLEGSYGLINCQITDNTAIGAIYGEFYPDSKNRGGENLRPGTPQYRSWQKDTAIYAKYDFTENFTFKTEFHFMDGAGLMFSADNPNGFEEKWEMLLIKVSYNF